MVCINFNSVISAAEESETDRFRHSNALVYQLPSQIWSVNEKMYNEVASIVFIIAYCGTSKQGTACWGQYNIQLLYREPRLSSSQRFTLFLKNYWESNCL